MELERDEGKQRMRRIAIVSFPLMMVAATLVIVMLQMSGFAGTMEDTQLGFNAEIMRYYFSLMSSEDLGLFIGANLGDYLFMLFYGIFFYSAGRLISWNYFRGVSNKIGLILAWVGVVAAILDGIENVFLLSMTVDPVGFASWLALAHSSFAFAKFLFMYAAMGWTIVGFVLNRTPLASWLTSGKAIKGTTSVKARV